MALGAARGKREDEQLPHETAELLLPWFVAGTLPEPERSAVEEHVRDCEACRREEAWLQGVVDAVRSRPVASPAPELGARVLARLAARQAAGPWWQRVWRVREARALLAVAVAEWPCWCHGGPAAPFRTLAGPTAAHVQVEATVVQGPGATGVYRLRLPPALTPGPWRSSSGTMPRSGSRSPSLEVGGRFACRVDRGGAGRRERFPRSRPEA